MKCASHPTRHHRRGSAWRAAAFALACFVASAGALFAQAPRTAPSQAAATTDAVRRTIAVGGVEREYFVRLPQQFDASRTYWLLLAAHGAGGNGSNFFLAAGIRRFADERQLAAIVVSPTFSATDT